MAHEPHERAMAALLADPHALSPVPHTAQEHSSTVIRKDRTVLDQSEA
jgi:hypothetical protein